VRVAVIGIGNVLAGDDAVGPHVVRQVEARYALPAGVEVLDAGTPGYDLTAFLAGLDAAILVDAVRAQGAPGELRTYDRAALLERGPVLALSPHEPGVRAALPGAVAQVARELAAVGVDVRERTPPAEPDLWWEREPGA
jgi:hydrogenase maturation protease